MTIETKQILECNYQEGEVKLNLKFDKDALSHKEDIEKMIKILTECKDDLVNYLKER